MKPSEFSRNVEIFNTVIQHIEANYCSLFFRWLSGAIVKYASILCVCEPCKVHFSISFIYYICTRKWFFCCFLAKMHQVLLFLFFHWYKTQEINYDSPRGGVSVITEKGEVTTSYLLIQKARITDSGHYTCMPSHANPNTVNVHVLNGNYAHCIVYIIHNHILSIGKWTHTHTQTHINTTNWSEREREGEKKHTHSFPFAPIPTSKLWALMRKEAIYQMAMRILFVRVNRFTVKFCTDCKIEFTSFTDRVSKKEWKNGGGGGRENKRAREWVSERVYECV